MSKLDARLIEIPLESFDPSHNPLPVRYGNIIPDFQDFTLSKKGAGEEPEAATAHITDEAIADFRCFAAAYGEPDQGREKTARTLSSFASERRSHEGGGGRSSDTGSPVHYLNTSIFFAGCKLFI